MFFFLQPTRYKLQDLGEWSAKTFDQRFKLAGVLKSEQNPSFWPIFLFRRISITRHSFTSISINLYMYIAVQTFSTFENVLIAKQNKQLPNHGANLESHDARLAFINFLYGSQYKS